MKLLSTKRIWGVRPHSAFTDLISFQGRLIVAFREGDAHVDGDEGKIRLIESLDGGESFRTLAVFEKKGLDLRDPKLCITPKGALQINFAALRFTPKRKTYREGISYTSFSNDGANWSKLQPIAKPHTWPWRITWIGGAAYTASYGSSNPKMKKAPWILTLLKSPNGIDFSEIVTWPLGEYPNETTLRGVGQKMVALVRAHEKGVRPWKSYNWIGTSEPPYTDWNWHKTTCHLGGPNFIVHQGRFIASGRILYPTAYGVQERVAVAEMSETDLKPVLLLPSSGDSSYPGLYVEGDTLFVSYYSSHEHNTAIYLAKISLA